MMIDDHRSGKLRRTIDPHDVQISWWFRWVGGFEMRSQTHADVMMYILFYPIKYLWSPIVRTLYYSFSLLHSWLLKVCCTSDEAGKKCASELSWRRRSERLFERHDLDDEKSESWEGVYGEQSIGTPFLMGKQTHIQTYDALLLSLYDSCCWCLCFEEEKANERQNELLTVSVFCFKRWEVCGLLLCSQSVEWVSGSGGWAVFSWMRR